MSEHFTLDEVAGNGNGRNTTFIDFTAAGGPAVSGGSDQQNTPKKVTPVQAGPIDMSSITPIDVDAILPRRQQAPSEMENRLMADLDLAVERECASITKRQNEIMELQRQELEAEQEAAEMRAIEAEDEFAVRGTEASSEEDYNYDDDADFSYDTARDTTASHFITPIVDDKDEDVSLPAPVDTLPVPTIPDNGTNLKVVKNPSILDNIADEDLFADDEDDVSANSNNVEVDTDALLEDLKKQIKEKASPIRKTLDLSKFTIAKKAISAQKVMKLAVGKHQTVADWVLLNANRPISVTGLSGPDILKLNPNNSNRNRLNTFRDMYRVIYDHLFDGNKPEFEAWLKQTRFIDLQHIYFALYMATFGDSNFVNYSCEKCNKVFIKDVDFRDMVDYADDETRTKVRNILKMDTTSPSKDTYPVDLVQINNSYVFGLRTPSIWNIIIETASLSDQFLEKHSDLIDMVAYIDSIYIIDEENSALIPVDTKPDPNDQAKTAGRRIKAFYDIIRSFSSEEYFALRAKISEYDVDAGKIIYKIPACTCPNCSAEIKENTDITPDSMLFTRHQLAAIGNT
jgi:hypothetical protein